MPPMGPFLDNVLWIGVLLALIFAASRLRVTSPEGWRDLRSSGKATLSSIAAFVGPREASRDAGWPNSGAMAAGGDILERWCAEELVRIEDERRRIEARHRELCDVIARLRARGVAPVDGTETKPN